MRPGQWIAGIWVGSILGAALMTFAFVQRERVGIYIPCDIAEISPDVPTAAKEQCRRKR